MKKALLCLFAFLFQVLVAYGGVVSTNFYVEDDKLKGEVVVDAFDRTYIVCLDTDNNADTGCCRGEEYWVVFTPGEDARLCDATDCDCDSEDEALQPYLEANVDGNTLSFAVDLSVIYKGSRVMNVIVEWKEVTSPSSVCALRGDFDGNGVIDVSDLEVFCASYGKSEGDPGFDSRCDFDGDGDVDGSDLSVIANGFEVTCP